MDRVPVRISAGRDLFTLCKADFPQANINPDDITEVILQTELGKCKRRVFMRQGGLHYRNGRIQYFWDLESRYLSL